MCGEWEEKVCVSSSVKMEKCGMMLSILEKLKMVKILKLLQILKINITKINIKKLFIFSFQICQPLHILGRDVTKFKW